MTNPPIYLLTDIERFDVAAWNRWRQENMRVPVDLSYADFTDMDVTNCNFSDCNLTYANFNYAVARCANFSCSILRFTRFCYADCSHAWMWSVDAQGARFGNTIVNNASFAYSNFMNVDMGCVELDGVDLRGTVGMKHPRVVSGTPVGSGHICSAMRNSDDTITIWAGCETFTGPDSVGECRERIFRLGGIYENDRNAWLDWVVLRLDPNTDTKEKD